MSLFDFFKRKQNNPADEGQSPDEKILIDLRQVIKKYQTPAGEFTALKGIDLQVKAGEFTAVIGKSGSGKSTLINMVTGIDRPTLGEVIVNNTAVHALSEDQMADWRADNLGIVFQFFQLLPTLTLFENVLLPMEISNKYNLKDRGNRAMHMLELVGLADQARKFPAAVSGGQQQRAAIARSLANDPAILVADEPTGNLDSRTGDDIFKLFENFVQQGRTILMVTHDRDLASRVSRVIYISDGEIADEVVADALPGLSESQKVQVLSHLEPESFAPNEVIIRQGDPAEHFYIVTKGVAEVSVKRISGEEIVVDHLGVGTYFGEMGIVNGGVRTATVRAAPDSEVTVMQLNRDAFVKMKNESNMTGEQIAREMRDRALRTHMSQALPSLSINLLKELTPKLDKVTYKPGEIIIRKGAPAEKFYIIDEGEVEVVAQDVTEGITVIARLKANQYFGEVGIIKGGTRTRTIRVPAKGEPVKLTVMGRDIFLKLMNESKLTQDEIAKVIQQRTT